MPKYLHLDCYLISFSFRTYQSFILRIFFGHLQAKWMKWMASLCKCGWHCSGRHILLLFSVDNQKSLVLCNAQFMLIEVFAKICSILGIFGSFMNRSWQIRSCVTVCSKNCNICEIISKSSLNLIETRNFQSRDEVTN